AVVEFGRVGRRGEVLRRAPFRLDRGAPRPPVVELALSARSAGCEVQAQAIGRLDRATFGRTGVDRGDGGRIAPRAEILCRCGAGKCEGEGGGEGGNSLCGAHVQLLWGRKRR